MHRTRDYGLGSLPQAKYGPYGMAILGGFWQIPYGPIWVTYQGGGAAGHMPYGTDMAPVCDGAGVVLSAAECRARLTSPLAARHD